MKPDERGRPPGFTYRKISRSVRHASEILHCESASLVSLAERFGTPLYTYSAAAIRQSVEGFRQAFRHVPHTLCYSVKANSNLSILALLAKLGCGFDVVSGGELERVLRVNRRLAKKVVFSGVGKTAEEISLALKAGTLLFNVESEAELLSLADCAARARRTAQIALRVNPDVPAQTHPYIATGLHEHKFGIPIGEAIRLYQQATAAKYLKVAGVSVHIGSQITEMEPFRLAMEKVATLVRQLRHQEFGISFVDAGGGLGIAYHPTDRASFEAQIQRYAQAVTAPLQGLKIHLLLEPGRSVIGPAGVLLTRVLYRKHNNGKHFLITDAAMNDLLRPALYNAHHEIVPIVIHKDAQREVVDIVGPICESGDFLARARELPSTSPGDLLAILDAGAYGMALTSNYNSRMRPAEVMVDGTKARLIRRRETISDLLRTETY